VAQAPENVNAHLYLATAYAIHPGPRHSGK
jgi:hypothetical protein